MSAGKITQGQDQDKLRKAKQKHGLSRVDIQTHITHHLTENRKLTFFCFSAKGKSEHISGLGQAVCFVFVKVNEANKKLKNAQ